HDSLIRAVGNPDRSVRSRAQAVRPFEQAGAKARNQAAACVKFLNRRDVRAFAGLSATAIEDPKTGAVAINVDADRLSPDSAVRKLRPVLGEMIGIRSAFLRLNRPTAGGNARKHDHPSGG